MLQTFAEASSLLPSSIEQSAKTLLDWANQCEQIRYKVDAARNLVKQSQIHRKVKPRYIVELQFRRIWISIYIYISIYDVGLSGVQFFSEDIMRKMESWKEMMFCLVLDAKTMSNVLQGLLERASDHSRLGYHHSSGQSRGLGPCEIEAARGVATQTARFKMLMWVSTQK